MTIKRSVAVLAIVILASCQKKNNDAVNASAVAITVQTPTEAHVYHNGDTVKVNAHVSYNNELHGYEVKITDTVTGIVLFETEEHAHKDAFDISESWRANVTAVTNAVVSIVVSVDHSGAQAKKDVSIRIEP